MSFQQDRNEFERIRLQISKLANNNQLDKTEREHKVARLIILLNKIEKELTTIRATLVKLRVHGNKMNPSSPTLIEVNHKIQQLDELTLKVRQARLNINVQFM